MLFRFVKKCDDVFFFFFFFRYAVNDLFIFYKHNILWKVFVTSSLPGFSLFLDIVLIRGQCVIQRGMGRGAPRYPPRDPGPYKGQIFRTRYLVLKSSKGVEAF